MDDKQRDDMLWKIAKKRAAFKRSFTAYFFVNAFLVGVWYFSSGQQSYFWPIWPMLGWGIGIAFQYSDAYHHNSFFTAEKEYEQLKRQQNNQQ